MPPQQMRLHQLAVAFALPRMQSGLFVTTTTTTTMSMTATLMQCNIRSQRPPRLLGRERARRQRGVSQAAMAWQEAVNGALVRVEVGVYVCYVTVMLGLCWVMLGLC